MPDLNLTDTPTPLIPAATLLLLRNSSQGLEVLLVRRNRALKAFGGAWVFPGGRVDATDGAGLDDMERHKITATRETKEETGLDISPSDMVTLSNWIPPTVEIRRFSTWFFVAKAPDQPVKIDEGEIHDFQWISPAKAISLVPSPDLVLFPPTYISLYSLKDFLSVDQALEEIDSRPNEHFETKFKKLENGFVTCWEGDCAYEDLDFEKDGPRRRLYSGQHPWRYETGS